MVTYPRPPGNKVDALIRQFPDRSCWYYRRDPQSGKAAVVRCEAAGDQLRRPHTMTEDDRCLVLRSTAELLGLHDPWPVIEANQLKKVRRELRPFGGR